MDLRRELHTLQKVQYDCLNGAGFVQFRDGVPSCQLFVNLCANTAKTTKMIYTMSISASPESKTS